MLPNVYQSSNTAQKHTVSNGLLDFVVSERAGLEELRKALKSGRKATVAVEERDDCGLLLLMLSQSSHARTSLVLLAL
ncbi:hypothetical protein H0H92_007895 [Tricholoma furcatifolium]|nr:hypothetical protein H0H92_007895 [Tricholoma furcatifolium]